ncbi:MULTISPECIES: hypothetical protein [Streptomyces]|uniref:hypothetical protein n=1 Tax=Streptomyces TaxID=1883 RepID=UPI000304A698|nr:MULTISPECIES: hypothetical protein [Streptomyces]
MGLRLLCLIFCRLLGCCLLLGRSTAANNAEILALRHESVSWNSTPSSSRTRIARQPWGNAARATGAVAAAEARHGLGGVLIVDPQLFRAGSPVTYGHRGGFPRL